MPRRPSRSSGTSRPLGHRVLVIAPPKPAPAESSTVDDTAAPAAAPDTSVDSISIASLTLDTPLIPFNPKKRAKSNPFLFLTLPSELRVRIYQYYFADADDILDLSPDNYKRMHKRLGIIRVCRQLHDEVTHYFYSTRAVRIFPTHPGKYFKSRKPFLARLKPNQRSCLPALELRLGPGWNAPPRGWAVNDALGLADCVSVRRLRVFVECDPSDSIFKGFRRSDGFYEDFSRNLLRDVLDALPSVRTVEFDAWSSVKRSGNMMQGLMQVASEYKHTFAWGPERGWTDSPEDDDKATPATLRFIGGKVFVYDHASQSMVAVA
jgi:hypothetical protein